MALLEQIQNIIGFQVNEEGLDESTVDFENEFFKKKCSKFEYKRNEQESKKNNILILSNKDFSLKYTKKELENKVVKPVLFIFCFSEEGFDKEGIDVIEDEIEEIIQTDELTKPKESNSKFTDPIIKLFFIYKDLETTIRSTKFLSNGPHDIRHKVQDLMKERTSDNKYPKGDISAKYDYFNPEHPFKSSPVRVLSRARVTQSKLLTKPETRGHVFSANLFDLVNLYNKKGKELFNRNIRFGINDELAVDTTIKATLAKSPEEFWYLNNGITLIIERDNLDLKDYERIILSDSPEKEEKIKLTVVNGAQTLNSAAEFFYGEEDDDNGARDKAFVMLKVIEILTPKKQKDTVDERIDNVTISLNRQKPIRVEDIAFTLAEVKQLNDFQKEIQEKDSKTESHEADLLPYVFSIVRRGDVDSIKNKRYTLNELARVLYTILLEQPGAARTGSIQSLIQIDSSGKSFKKKGLFPTICRKDKSDKTDEMDKTDETDETEKLFKRHYKAVNFSMSLYEKIGKLAKDKKKLGVFNTINTSSINNYGKYLMIFSIVKVLKGNEDKFENWKYTDEDVAKVLNDETYIKIVKALAKSWDDTVKAGLDHKKWDSNAFKNTDNMRNTYKACKNVIKEILDQKNPDEENPDQKNPDQENPDQENPDQENPDQENPDQENSDEENPDQENPDQENPDQENPDQENPDQENPDQENPDQENPDQENPDQENPKIKGMEQQKFTLL